MRQRFTRFMYPLRLPFAFAAMFIAVMPYGLAWTFLGLRMIARGSATIFETPSSPRATEVLAT